MTADAGKLRAKAQRARARHGARLGISTRDLEYVYGWTTAAMVATYEAAIDAGVCPYHGGPYDNYGDDLTVDVTDPTLAPYWGANTRACCATCNKRMGRRSPIALAVADAERASPPPAPVAQLDLFGGAS
jgi:hypothetical protein